MEITLPHEQLQKALELTGRISAKNPTLPILQCVRLVATEENIHIEATNLEIHISIPITGTVTEAGEVAVPMQTFLQSVQLIAEKDMTLRLEDNVLQLETSESNTSIKTCLLYTSPSPRDS